MKSLLFALGLALFCAVQAERFENVDHSKINRNQYVTAMATNCKKMKEMLPHMKATPVTFEPKSADEIKTTIDMVTQMGCKTIHPVLKRENGVFTTTCAKGGKKTMNEIEMTETSVYTSITISHRGGECKMVSLSVNNLEDTPGALDGFRVFVDKAGLENENIQVLSTEGMCPRSA